MSDYDGLLGLDFFEDVMFCIDMKNQTIEVKNNFPTFLLFFLSFKKKQYICLWFFTWKMALEEDMISLLEGKIRQVIQVAEGLIINNNQLKQQVDELSGLLRVKDQEMEVLESKFQSLRLAKTLVSSPEDVKNAKQQVNRMVREIDKCIALLNR